MQCDRCGERLVEIDRRGERLPAIRVCDYDLIGLRGRLL